MNLSPRRGESENPRSRPDSLIGVLFWSCQSILVKHQSPLFPWCGQRILKHPRGLPFHHPWSNLKQTNRQATLRHLPESPSSPPLKLADSFTQHLPASPSISQESNNTLNLRKSLRIFENLWSRLNNGRREGDSFPPTSPSCLSRCCVGRRKNLEGSQRFH